MTDPAAPSPAATGSARRVLLEILIHGPLSRVELAERLGLSGPSLTRLTKPLLATGQLVGGTPRAGAAGRPPQPLDVDPASAYFAGVKITADAVYSVVTDLRGQVQAEHEHELVSHDPDDVADLIAVGVTSVAGAFEPLAGIGISLGGTSADGRIVGRSHFLDWSAVPLADLVEARTGHPVVVANDVTALTQAQHWFGAGRGLDTFAVVTVGAGVGMGVVAGGEVVAGAHGAAGSIGHQLLTWSAPVCWRGHHGCASALLTTDAIEAAAAACGSPLSFDAVLDAAADDPALRDVVDTAGAALGLLLASVANTIDPERIVLAGEGARLGLVAERAMHAAFAAAAAGELPPLDVQPFAFTEWARGAAVTAIRARMLR